MGGCYLTCISGCHGDCSLTRCTAACTSSYSLGYPSCNGFCSNSSDSMYTTCAGLATSFLLYFRHLYELPFL